MARIIHLDGLSPAIKTAILQGTQPGDVTLKGMLRTRLPLDWAEQERRFGAPRSALP